MKGKECVQTLLDVPHAHTHARLLSHTSRNKPTSHGVTTGSIPKLWEISCIARTRACEAKPP